MAYINVKLPNSVVAVFMPSYTTTLQYNYQPRTRTLSTGATRTLSDGTNRTINDEIRSYPELVAVKLPSHIISVSVPS